MEPMDPKDPLYSVFSYSSRKKKDPISEPIKSPRGDNANELDISNDSDDENAYPRFSSSDSWANRISETLSDNNENKINSQNR